MLLVFINLVVLPSSCSGRNQTTTDVLSIANYVLVFLFTLGCSSVFVLGWRKYWSP